MSKLYGLTVSWVTAFTHMRDTSYRQLLECKEKTFLFKKLMSN